MPRAEDPIHAPRFPAAAVRRRLLRVLGSVPSRFIHVSIRGQTLRVIDRGSIRAVYPVSTARAGAGCRANSMRTPTGVHVVARRFGASAPLGAIFLSRAYTGRRWREGRRDHDLILTRILWLRGLEPGHNSGPGVDSYKRYIYIHGTNHEHSIGRPASHGCVRMRNADIVELFALARRGTIVTIS